jgi:hypothetical protein
MDKDREKQELQERLVRCHRLANEYTDGVTARNLRELAAELEQKIRAIDQ